MPLRPRKQVAEGARAVDNAQLTCPTGHKLPHDPCTPLFCGAMNPLKGNESTESKEKRIVKLGEQDLALETGRISRAKQRLGARRGALSIPEGLEGSAAVEYVEKKLDSLLPDAVAEWEFQLLYGSDEQRERAA